MKLTVKNWSEFQHYKDRMPPWIKLHKALLDDRTFQRLPDASRALAPCLWLLASESKDGIFEGSVEEIAFRVHQSEKWTDAALKPLISSGFFIVVRDASNALAECRQLAVPETEAERETKTEKALGGKPPDERFEEAWKRYPKRSGNNPKADALKAWDARIKEGVSSTIMEMGLTRYVAWCESTGKVGTETVMQAVRFFGKSRPFEQDWELPKKPINGSAQAKSDTSWLFSDEATNAKGREVGILPRIGESMDSYRDRLRTTR